MEYGYRKIIAVKIVFVRFLKIFGGDKGKLCDARGQQYPEECSQGAAAPLGNSSPPPWLRA